ncbi:hypothetical protein SDC9_129920 [bioreactor metagenome]|uniref:Uncharacterized protein n=1 Tax=bioreactor metagenome TaxID=1076179 RepID=A0A645D161_9ZZZZ
MDVLLGITGEARNGFHKDSVDLAVPAVLNQPVEIIPLACHKAGDALVGVYVGQFPIFMAGNMPGVVIDLCDVGVELIVRLAADAGICGHVEFCDFVFFCRNDRDFRRHDGC